MDNLVKLVIVTLIVISVMFGGAFIYENVITNTSPTQEPAFANASTAPPTPIITTQTYYLGQQIAGNTQSPAYFFHGIMKTYYGGLNGPDVLTIGHEYLVPGSWGPVMSDIQLTINKGGTIHIDNSQYKIVDYGSDWITLQS